MRKLIKGGRNMGEVGHANAARGAEGVDHAEGVALSTLWKPSFTHP